MSTVPGPDTPAPANNAKTTLLSSDPGLYVRPTAGGNASGGAAVPPGPTPASSISMAGAPVGTGGTQTGPDMGHGATQILNGISGGGDTDNDGDTL